MRCVFAWCAHADNLDGNHWYALWAINLLSSYKHSRAEKSLQKVDELNSLAI